MTTQQPSIWCPPELLSGATRFKVRTGFTGLRWNKVARTLTPAGRTYLRREFVPTAVATFTGTTEQFWLNWLADDCLDELDGLVIVLDSAGIPVAWVASNKRRFGSRTCFYANSAGVHPDHQGSGLSSAIWRELLRSAVLASAPRRLYAVMRTANPLVYSAWSAGAGGFDKAYPSPLTSDIPEPIARIASDAARHIGQYDRFDPATSVITEAYDHTDNGLWTERPTSDQRTVDDWMRAILGPKDALVLVVAFDPIPMLLHELVRTVRTRLGMRTTGTTRSSRAA